MNTTRVIWLTFLGLLLTIPFSWFPQEDRNDILSKTMHSDGTTVGIGIFLACLWVALWRSKDGTALFSVFRRQPVQPTECPQLKILCINGVLDDGVRSPIQDIIARHSIAFPGRNHVAIMAENIRSMDRSGAKMLIMEARRFRSLGGGFYLIHANDHMLHTLEQVGGIKDVGKENIFATKKDAMEKIFPRLDGKICRQCSVRRSLESCDLVPSPTSMGNRFLRKSFPSYWQ
ncbi:MAG: sodium-independent anion transporter [Magnetococcales bacterium]|nr:sodium-independent anion transporter [Magnetococcales bacterium]